MKQEDEEYIIFDDDLPPSKKPKKQSPSKQKAKRKPSNTRSSKDECETPKKKIKTEPKTPTTSPSTSKTSQRRLKKSPVKKEIDSSFDSPKAPPEPPKKKTRKTPAKKTLAKIEQEDVPKKTKRRHRKKNNADNDSNTETVPPNKEGDSDGSLDDESYEIVPSNDTQTEEFLIEKKQEKLAHFSYIYRDLCTIVLDEISLEGLDGITIEALWLRLSVTLEEPLPLPRNIQVYVWNLIVCSTPLSFYELPTARPKLVIFDRFEYIDPESGTVVDPLVIPEDIYPFKSVMDKENDIVGSCMSYKARIDISETVRNLNLAEALSRYGNKLVVVANQKQRNLALFGEFISPHIKLTESEYCLLERIGRSRKLGEVTTGKISLQVVSKDPKTLFYYRKILLKHKIISKQTFNLKLGNQNSVGGLFHLHRFYNERKCKRQIIIEQLVEVLKKRPKHRIEYMEVRRLFGPIWKTCGIQKIVKTAEFKQYIRTDMQLPYREMYPNATPAEWKRKIDQQEKKIRILELVNPKVNVSATWGEEEQKDESSDDEPTGDISLHFPLYFQCFKLILNSGQNGLSLKETKSKLGLGFYATRSILCNMTKRNVIDAVVIDSGRQRITKYHARCFNDADFVRKFNHEKEHPPEVEQERDEGTLDFIADVLEIDSKHLKRPRFADACSPETTVVEGNAIKGYYGVIRDSRRKNKFKIPDVSDSDKNNCFKEIFKNAHGYNSNGVSLELKVFKNFDSGFPYNRDFEKVCKETWSTEEETPRHTIYPSKKTENESLPYLENVKNFLNKTIVNKPNPVFLRSKPLKTSELISALLFSKTKNDLKHIIARSNETLKEFSEGKNLMCPSDFDSDDEYCSVEEPADETSLIVQFDSMDNGERTVQKSREFVDYLLTYFEYADFYLTSEILNDGLNEVNALAKICCNPTEISKSAVKKIKSESLELENIGASQIVPFSLDASTSEPSQENSSVDCRLGPNPILIHYDVDEDEIETSMYCSGYFDEIPFPFPDLGKLMGMRNMNRYNLILDLVNNQDVMDLVRIKVLILKHERERGMEGQFDRKSLNRILLRLIKVGSVKAIKIVLRRKEAERIKYYVTKPDYDKNVILQIIRQLKMKFFFLSKSQLEKTVDLPIKYAKMNGKAYGYKTKFPRIRVLHEFLFYLIYDFSSDQKIEAADVPEFLERNNVEIDEDFHYELTPIYKQEINWKMFVPPLKAYQNMPGGWAFVSDVILRMPISIYVTLFNTLYVIPELEEYLNHPVKKFVLIKNMPIEVREACFYRRKYIFSMNETLSFMCYLGLIRFGPQVASYKDHLYVYLNRNAILFDTTTSEPGYHQVSKKEYAKTSFAFNTAADLNKYWTALFKISMHTKLGKRVILEGKYVTIESVSTKPDMVRSTKSVNPEEAPRRDVGYIPGDGLGAAGFDSAIWVHVKRNWVWSSSKKSRAQKAPSDNVTGTRKKYMDKINFKPIIFKDLPKKSKAKRVKKKRKFETNSKKVVKTKKLTRFIVPRTKKKVHVDDLDRSIGKKMGTARSIWSEEEDDMLLLCRAATDYLCANVRKKLIASTTIRDVMHIYCSKYDPKTSKAYQRRIVFQRRRNYVNKIPLKEIYVIQKYFKKIQEKVANKSIKEGETNIAFIYLIHLVYTLLKDKSAFERINLTVVDYLTEENISSVKWENMDSQSKVCSAPITESDLEHDLIKSIILSSLSCKPEQPDWSIKLFNAYQKFSEEQLKKTLNTLRNQQLLSAKKKNSLHSGKNEMYVAGISFQLSFAYIFKQITKYPQVIFKQAEEYYSGIQKYQKNNPADGLSIKKFQQGHGLAMLEHFHLSDMEFTFSIADDIVTLNPNLPDYETLIEELIRRYKCMLSKKNCKSGENYFPYNVPEHVSALDIRRYIKKMIHSSSKEIKTEDTSKDRETEETTDQNLKMSHLAFLLTKGLFPELDDENKLMELNDCFLVVYPVPKLSTPEVLVDDILKLAYNYEQMLSDIKRDYIFSDTIPSKETIEEKFVSLGSTGKTLTAIGNLIEFVKERKFLGTNAALLKAQFTQDFELNLEVILNTLIDINVLIVVGISELTFVHHDYGGYWTTTTSDLHPRTEENNARNCLLRIMPWASIDGFLYEAVLQNWFYVMLTYSLSYPSTPFNCFVNRFCHLKPIDIYFLLDYLQRIGCLEIVTYEEEEEATLLSEYKIEYKTTRPATILDKFDDMIIETKPTAVAALATFLKHIHENLDVPFEE